MASPQQSEINWHLEMLPLPTQTGLRWLSEQGWLKQSRWYLAGGTALTLQTGHRLSVDLDFFTPQTVFNMKQLVGRFVNCDWEETFRREATVYGSILGAKVSFIAYPFFVPAQPFHRYGNVRVLDARDIAVMKIIAISQRGRKRDFYDLYWYVKNCEPLLDVVRRLPAQYPSVAHNYHHILKALTYFVDAEHDPEPRLNFKVSWKTVKDFFKKETNVVARKVLRL